MRERRRYLWILGSLVVALFVSGVVWRAFHPRGGENVDQEAQLAARQDGYYLCLHRPPMTPANMYRLVRRRLPNDDPVAALRGCREAQRH
jgi:cbb3-type cytochrome oxidase subunit 3